MNHFPIVLLMVIVLQAGVVRPQHAGIFLHACDLSAGQVFSADKGSRMRMHDLIGGDHLEIRHNDSVYRFLKNEIYGYRNAEGETFRFFKNKPYRILNPGEEILIYHTSTGNGMKNSPVKDYYFFSKNAGGNLQDLDLSNLLLTFAQNPAFTLLLELHYKTGADLLAYDPVHHMYKLNRLLALSRHLDINQ